MASTRFKLVFFVPRESTQSVLSRLFAINTRLGPTSTIGRIGLYDECAFVSPGVGQFLPTSGAKPAVGSVGGVERVEEDRVETLVVATKEGMKDILNLLKDIHPYEEVAYDVYKLEDF